MLDTLEFGQKRERASDITVVALRVSDSIRELAIRILQNPVDVNKLIEKWQKSVKLPRFDAITNRVIPGGTIEDNASTIHQKSGGRGDFEARVLALYRALDGDVYDKGRKIVANVRRTKAPTTGAIAASGRTADHRDHLRRARLLLQAVAEEDLHIHDRIVEKVKKNHVVVGIPDAVQQMYADDDRINLYRNSVAKALAEIRKREALWG